MSNKNEDRADKAFVQGYKEFFSLNPESLSPEEIKDLNNGAIGKKAKKKHLVTTWHDVSSSTFIIPVSDGGTITAYFLMSQKQKDEMGVMPLTIFLHGGGWLHGNMDFYSSWLKYFAYTMKTAVLLVDYRLAPTYKFPTAIEDCYDAIIWAIEGAKYWKIDPDQIYVA
ncbi:MAG: alpha/beta hydrolase fold domain-containing protein, partial [Sphaerochaetaceae bacterium]|nr:alpha/beta hydrolase fold domain-containing protein [Sphaerochaetaceae bacterium]